RQFLREHGIEANEESNDTSTTIALGEEGHLSSDVKKMEGDLTTLNNSDIGAEGYVLNIESEANELSQGGTIFLKGKDGDGTFYGIKTLIQLAEKDDDLLTFE